MKMNLCVRLATLGPIGYFVAPGTVATLVTMPCMYLLRTSLNSELYLLVLLGAVLLSIPIINSALEYFKDFQDPSQVVLDEVLGCLITFYAIPLSWATMLAGFLLFRFFDITKWFGIEKAEHLVGAWGIVMDDLLAGVLANVVLQISCHFIFGT
jgi:phosphatidylglycerophosphatase A